MKITVVNGSPKGKYSCTLQTSLFLEKRFPEHSFEVVGVMDKKRDKAFASILSADIVIFSYPVYTFLAPSQLHFFIRDMKTSGIDFSGKWATQITTSKHFYDSTAHRYLSDNLHDMGFKVVPGLSADMEDLTKEKGQREAETFFSLLIHSVENDIFEPSPSFLSPTLPEFKPLRAMDKKEGKRVVVVADYSSGSERLKSMVSSFQSTFSYPVEVIDIGSFPFKGGCLGCFNCAGDGKCIWRDGYEEMLRGNIQKSDAIVIAFSILDHSMGPVFKTYDDRQFCNGHRTVTEGTPFAYIVDGSLDGEENLRTVIEARSEVGHNYLAGVAVDSETMEAMEKRLEYSLENRVLLPRNFYGVGGMKIFRDLIWVMRGIMKADHIFYKKKGVYDFPQKERGKMMVMCLLGAMVRNPKIKKKMGNKMNEGMVAPYKKVIEKAEPRK